MLKVLFQNSILRYDWLNWSTCFGEREREREREREGGGGLQCRVHFYDGILPHAISSSWALLLLLTAYVISRTYDITSRISYKQTLN